jgi:AcrR family transcriptional regulator
MRSPKTRPYRKSKRAVGEERTRARIVDAAETLHGSLGPSRTSISAVAELAGVTRATVYRHFPDDESLFLACSSQWLERQPVPDPSTWTSYDGPEARLRAGLTDIYRFYRSGEPMISLVQRDADAVPQAVRRARLEQEQQWILTLLQPFPGRRRKTVRAAVAHAVAFTTWRSLCVAQELSDKAAVDLVVGMVTAAS